MRNYCRARSRRGNSCCLCDLRLARDLLEINNAPFLTSSLIGTFRKVSQFIRCSRINCWILRSCKTLTLDDHYVLYVKLYIFFLNAWFNCIKKFFDFQVTINWGKINNFIFNWCYFMLLEYDTMGRCGNNLFIEKKASLEYWKKKEEKKEIK